MADFEIPEEPEYINNIRKIETTDPVHADFLNNIFQALVNNDEFLKKVAEQLQQAISQQHEELTGYTDTKIGQLINGAPETLDTLKEVADAIQENETVVNALDEAIGTKLNKDGDASNTTVTFTSLDNTDSPTVWTTMKKIVSGKISDILNGVSIMSKNLKYLYKKLGTTDISGLADGTLTGAVSKLNTDITIQLSDKITLHCVGKYVEIDLYDYTISDNIIVPAEYIPLGRPLAEIAVIHAGPDRLTTGRILINGVNLVFYSSDWTNITHEQGYYVRGSISYIRATGI